MDDSDPIMPLLGDGMNQIMLMALGSLLSQIKI